MTPAEPCIVAVGTALPGEHVDNTALASRLGVDEEWIDTFIGTRSRHFAVDLGTGKRHATLTDLCVEAAASALEDAGLAARDVGFVVLSTASPDELMPATVNRVADRLGIDQVPTYQLQSGCAGAVQAIELGAMLLGRTEQGVGLVVGGDSCAKHMRLDRELTRLPPRELVNFLLFGDGAGAAVLARAPAAGGAMVRAILNQFTGLGQPPGQVVRWFGEADRGSEEQAVDEDYKAIEQRVPTMATEILSQLLEVTGWDIGDVNYLLPPQLSGRMTAEITRRLNVPSALEISCVAETGNNGNALPFFQLDRLAGRMAAGEKALAISVESSKWIKGGFALEAV